MKQRKLNTYYFIDNCAVGKLTNCEEEFVIDIDDYEAVSQYSWRKQNNNNIYTNLVRNSPISLPRFILKSEKDRVFFINHDFHDCRKSNLFCGNKYEYNLEKNVYYVTCFDGTVFMIDKEDYLLVKDFVWHKDGNGYIITKKNGEIFKLHRLLMGLSKVDNLEVDHVDRNPLNNTRSNLRLATRSENCINRDVSSFNKSGCVGVYWNNSVQKWAVQINKDGNRYYLGVYSDFDEAVKVRQKAESDLFGDFIPNNRQSATKPETERSTTIPNGSSFTSEAVHNLNG